MPTNSAPPAVRPALCQLGVGAGTLALQRRAQGAPHSCPVRTFRLIPRRIRQSTGRAAEFVPLRLIPTPRGQLRCISASCQPSRPPPRRHLARAAAATGRGWVQRVQPGRPRLGAASRRVSGEARPRLGDEGRREAAAPGVGAWQAGVARRRQPSPGESGGVWGKGRRRARVSALGGFGCKAARRYVRGEGPGRNDAPRFRRRSVRTCRMRPPASRRQIGHGRRWGRGPRAIRVCRDLKTCWFLNMAFIAAPAAGEDVHGSTLEVVLRPRVPEYDTEPLFSLWVRQVRRRRRRRAFAGGLGILDRTD